MNRGVLFITTLTYNINVVFVIQIYYLKPFKHYRGPGSPQKNVLSISLQQSVWILAKEK